MARSIYCSKCKLEKEDAVKNESYCKACKSERMKVAAMKKRLAQGLTATREVRKARCDVCIAKQEAGEDIRGRCRECHAMAQHERIVAQRMIEGKEPESTRSTVNCLKCGEPKVDGRCMPCNNKVKAANKAEKRKRLREEQGKKQWGTGRQLTCYTCGKVKEKPSASLCDSCNSEYHKKHWSQVIAPKVNQRVITMICECGKEKASTRRLYCDDCLSFRKAKANREAAQVRRDRLKKNGKISFIPFLTDEEKAMRSAARNYLQNMIKQGYITRLNCEVCGSDVNIEGHHDDYTKPLDVRWLCKTHHAEHHFNENEHKRTQT